MMKIESPLNLTGPMFAGKTTELIRRAERERIAGKKVVIIKLEQDLRFGQKEGDNALVTHSQIRYDRCEVKYAKHLDNGLYLYIMAGGYQAVGIEEGQFFDNISKFCDLLTFNGVKVFVTSLNSDFLQRPFHSITLLNSKAKVIQLTAICLDCKNDNGVYSVRTAKSNDLILIGGKEAYRSVCAQCVHKYNSPADIIMRAYTECKELFGKFDGTRFPEITQPSDVIKGLPQIMTNIESYKQTRQTMTDPVSQFALQQFYKKIDDLIDTIVTYRVLVN